MPAKHAFAPSRPGGSAASENNAAARRRASNGSNNGDSHHPGGRRGGSGGARDGLPVPRSQQAPRFWQCQEDALLFKGPLGEPVGLLPKDTVVWEQQRYEDPFCGWWVAIGTHEGELAWIDVNNSAGSPLLQDPHTRADPVWLPVVEETPTTAPATADSRGGARSRATANKPAAGAPMAAAAAAAPPAAVRTTQDAPAGASVEIHLPCKPDGSTGLPLDTVESLWRQSPPPLELYEHYWTSIATAAPPADKDWNQRYQSLVEAVIHQADAAGDAEALQVQLEAAELALYNFLESFHDTAEEVAVLFVKDQLAPSNARAMTPHPQRKDVFYYKGLLVTVCIDTADGAYGGDAGAKKVASNAFRSYALAAQEGPKNLLYVPLQTLVSFHGYTLSVSTIPPVDATGCLYAPLRRLRTPESGTATSSEIGTDGVGTSNNSNAQPVEEDMPEVLQYLCAQFSQSLNLAEHAVTVVDRRTGASHTWKTSLPITTELYAGRDRRIYLLAGADRLLPAQLPLFPTTATEGKKASSSATASAAQRRGSSSASSDRLDGDASTGRLLRASVTRRVRPELLVQWASPLNSDVAVDGCHDIKDVIASADVADFVKRDAITAVASMIGLQLPVDTTPLPPLPCTLCDAIMENELRFVVCQNEERCCRICTHCYTKRLYEHFTCNTDGAADNGGATAAAAAANASDDDWRVAVDFADAVQCGASPRPADALQMEPSVARLAHASGLNLRYLPFVYYRLPLSSRFATERYCEVELVARAAAHVLDDKLRRVTTVEEVHSTIQQFFLALLQSKATEAQRFWAKELGPRIEATFDGLCAPLDLSQLSVLLLAERVESLTGVELSEASRNSLTSEKPFVEVVAVRPRVKRSRPPQCHISQVQAEGQRIRGMLSKLLLFWIGYAPKNCRDELQPLYLQKNLTTT